MKANPKMWCASKHSERINYRKVTQKELMAKPGSYHEGRATYHDTWAEARAALVARLSAEVERQRKDYDRAGRWLMQACAAVERAENMRVPAALAAPVLPATGEKPE